MKNYQKSFLKLALESNSLQFGEFVLKSGRKSPYFFNAANMLNGSNLYELAKCYTDAIEETNLEFDSIFGPAYKGIFLGSIVATLLSEQGKNFPLCFNRKEEKDHGEGGSIIGEKPSGDVLIIDDVLSAGGRLGAFLLGGLHVPRRPHENQREDRCGAVPPRQRGHQPKRRGHSGGARKLEQNRNALEFLNIY